jgi:hypothetical protein
MKPMWTLLAVLSLAVMPAFSQRVKPKPRPEIESGAGIGENIITHVADGGGWKTVITVANLSQDKAAAFTLNFYGDDGNPKSFSFAGIGTGSYVTATLPVAGSIVIQTTGAGAGTQGWAQFDYSSTSDFVGGYAVFVNSNGNEAAVPFESDIAGDEVLPFDNANGYGMGVALANSDFETVTVTATCRDENGNVLGTDAFTMASMTHMSFIFSQRWPFTANRKGTVYFKTTDGSGSAFGLAVLGLRFTPGGGFTSVASLQAYILD